MTKTLLSLSVAALLGGLSLNAGAAGVTADLAIARADAVAPVSVATAPIARERQPRDDRGRGGRR